MEVKRGDIVTVAIQGDYGKPRPALVIQSDCFAGHPSIVVCPMTSHLVDAPLLRIPIEAGRDTGLTVTSQVMVDKITAVKMDKIGQVIGHLAKPRMIEVERCLAVLVGLG